MSSLSPAEVSIPVAPAREANYTGEARAVQTAAAQRSTHVVRVEQIVFFSTYTGDAWMLDAKDRSAACLARDGEPLPIPIVEESSASLSVQWKAEYRIDGDAFTVSELDGGSSHTMVGYPTAEIERLVEHAERESPDYAPASAARARLKTGRNEPCSCGSGRKYKKCCLANDEVLVRQADAARRAEASKVSSNSLPAKPVSAPSAPKSEGAQTTDRDRNQTGCALGGIRCTGAAHRGTDG
jgi:hypothetical protein